MIILCASLLCSCTVKLAYHFLDWGLQYKLNHYLSLNDAQTSQAKTAIKEFHHWHQRHELPDYVVFLKDAKNRLSGPSLTAAEIAVFRQRIKGFGERSLDFLMPNLSSILKSLDQKQKRQLFKTLDADQKDYAELYLTPSMDDIREVLKNDALKSIKKYMGRLSGPQKALVASWSQAVQPFGPAASEEQDKWELLMGQLLEQPAAPNFTSKLKSLMLYDFSSWETAHRQVMEHNQAISYQLMADLLNSRSAEQNASLLEKLDVYIADCEDLIDQARENDTQNNQGHSD